MKRYYMKCSKDIYKLPEAVAESMSDLARMTGYNLLAVESGFRRVRHGRVKDSIWVIVDLSDEDVKEIEEYQKAYAPMHR